MPEQTTTSLALAVWPPAGTTRRTHRYLTATTGKHRIDPDLAARAILAYTDPGDLVIDPRCATGTVLIEAIHHGRRAVGVEQRPRLAALATANVSHARQQGAPGRAAVLEGNPNSLPKLLTKAASIVNATPGRAVRRHPAGSAQLLLTAAPARPESPVLEVWASVVTPGGFLLLVHTQKLGTPRAGIGDIVAAAEQAGLAYWQHVVALRTAEARLLHTDVLAFRKQPADAAAARTATVVGRKAVAA